MKHMNDHMYIVPKVPHVKPESEYMMTVVTRLPTIARGTRPSGSFGLLEAAQVRQTTEACTWQFTWQFIQLRHSW